MSLASTCAVPSDEMPHPGEAPKIEKAQGSIFEKHVQPPVPSSKNDLVMDLTPQRQRTTKPMSRRTMRTKKNSSMPMGLLAVPLKPSVPQKIVTPPHHGYAFMVQNFFTTNLHQHQLAVPTWTHIRRLQIMLHMLRHAPQHVHNMCHLATLTSIPVR